jgi:hypothetical protein
METQMLPDSKRLFVDHMTLLGLKPTSTQISLYGSFPSKRGYVWTGKHDEERFDAVFLTAFSQAFQREGEDAPNRVYLLIPPTSRDWVLVQVKRLTKVIFGRCKERKAVDRAKELGKLFSYMMVGGRVHQMGIEPSRWSAYGFSSSDLVPEWVSKGLLV